MGNSDTEEAVRSVLLSLEAGEEGQCAQGGEKQAFSTCAWEQFDVTGQAGHIHQRLPVPQRQSRVHQEKLIRMNVAASNNPPHNKPK